ncbi:sensor histidine kinase [Curtobacterium sp. MCBD17_023]|uniref:sensor histidine kinase n=1 Tax=Curtobacterium sp. MCBD17_023 TaxID=2175657 RepID=UPI000D97ABAD|nr:sensor histidine kinase [Curtobacterium sp. MCBD17_023]PYY47526.1 sensor histidine kinase [Curtobacterium sp. MCBD17_023]
MTERRRRYVDDWRGWTGRTWYLLTALPVDLVGFVVVLTLLCLGIGLGIVWVGLPVLAVTVRTGRLLGVFARRRAGRVGEVPDAPDWTVRPTLPTGVPGVRLVAPLADTRNWAATVHTLATFPVSVATWVATVTWGALALGAVTYPAWSWAVTPADDIWLERVAAGIGETGQWTGTVLRPVVVVLAGLVLAATFPFVTRVLVVPHLVLAGLLLGERQDVQLLRGAQRAEAGRRAALLAEDASLRRLERDIHDGPQQQLLRLQYDLAIALRRFPDDTAAAERLVEESLDRSKVVLETIRNLSRGLAPPILQDRGLAAAVQALAEDSVLPTTADVRLDAAGAGLAAVERSAYAILSELLTNVTKHAHASSATIRAVAAPGGDLELEVRDDGVGGARLDPGHGLDGLRDRVEGLQGVFTVISPPGGPTVVRVRIPVPVEAPATGGRTLAG